MSTFCRLFFCLWLLAYDGLFPFGQTPEMEMEMNNRTIGDRIRALRIGAGLSQDEMAEALFVGSRVSISQYESGKRELSIQLVMAYAEYFKVTTDYIIFGKYPDDFVSDSDKEIMETIKALKNPTIRKTALLQIKVLAEIGM